MLAVGMLVSVSASLLQIVSTGFVMSTLLMMLMALGNSLAFPNVSALISRQTDPDHQGQMLGLNNAAGASARVAGPLAANIALKDVHLDSPFLIAALTMAPAIMLAFAVHGLQGRARDNGSAPPTAPR